MEILREFYAVFGDKYTNLELKEVVVKKREGVCTITFLYPSTDKELSFAEKEEIEKWFKTALNLEKLAVKVKFLRVFVEEKLILKAIKIFFEKKYKLVETYVDINDFKVAINPIDVVINVSLSPRMNAFFVEHKISAELSKMLKENFLTEFVVNIIENVEIVDDVDIENVSIKTTLKPVQRYKVEIIKDIISKGIVAKPEYISFITQPKTSVVVAGYIKKIERREFVKKTGKNAGKTKAYYNFTIADEKGKLDCIYFSSKANEKVMDVLEEYMYVLLHGDVKKNLQNKLCLYVDKIALASKVESQIIETQRVVEGPVVAIEKMSSLEQDSLFEQTDKYNENIMGKTIVVFDVETTGLDPSTDEIIELGAVKLKNGVFVEKFSTFVRPTKQIPYEVVKLTGISQDMVEDAPPIEYVIKEFHEFSKGAVLCGHNLIGFDIKFVRRESQVVGLEFDNQTIDTLNLARTSHLKISKFNLGAVVKALGITLENAHRAWNDAYATAQVLLKLNENKNKNS